MHARLSIVITIVLSLLAMGSYAHPFIFLHYRDFASSSFYDRVDHNSTRVVVTENGREYRHYFHKHYRFHHVYPYYYGAYYDAKNRD